MTRRAFVGAAACAGSARARMRQPELRCALVDLGSDCVLRESLAGFAGAMPGAIKVSAEQLTDRQECVFYAVDQKLMHRQECLFYVVPGAGAIDHDLGLRLARMVDREGWLVFESAAGFASEAAFRTQREMLASYFGLAIERPMNLRESGESIVPYVDYAWPAAVKIRDFSRVVPVRCETSEVIGAIAGRRLAVRRRVGRGVLIFLGSPIGPALGAGDQDAHRWLKSLMALGPVDSTSFGE
jgi:hypothetical protein